MVRTYGSTEHFQRKLYPLRDATRVEEAVDYPLPDPANPARHAHLKPATKALHARDLAVQGELYVTIFETAWSIRGTPKAASTPIMITTTDNSTSENPFRLFATLRNIAVFMVTPIELKK